jgi:hypothetical protein
MPLIEPLKPHCSSALINKAFLYTRQYKTSHTPSAPVVLLQSDRFRYNFRMLHYLFYKMLIFKTIGFKYQHFLSLNTFKNL